MRLDGAGWLALAGLTDERWPVDDDCCQAQVVICRILEKWSCTACG